MGEARCLELLVHPCCASRAQAVTLGQRVTGRRRGIRFEVRALRLRCKPGQGITLSPTWRLDGQVVWVGLPTFQELWEVVEGGGR
jgi:hypothetical protein